MTTHTQEFSGFTSCFDKGIMVVRLKKYLLNISSNISDIFDVYKCLEHETVHGKAKALVVVGARGEHDYCSYVKTLCDSWSTTKGEGLFEQLCNTKNAIIINLVRSKMITVHADRGRTPLYNLNVSLAYDYRIVAEGTIFDNQSAAYGIVPMGGGGYFLPRALGMLKASRLAMRPSVTAEEALELGLIDEIVPEDQLEARAVDIARSHLDERELIRGVRRLYKFNLNELSRSLHKEDDLARARFMDKDFRKSVSHACEE